MLRNWILLDADDQESLAGGILEGRRMKQLPDFTLQFGILKYEQRDYPAARKPPRNC